MQGMEQRLRKEIRSLDIKLSKQIDNVCIHIDRMDVNFNTQVDGIDDRVDDLETNRIPRIEKHVGLTA